MSQTIATPLDSNAFLNYLAQGNPFIWIVFIFVLLTLFIMAWIYFEPKIRSLVFFIKDSFSKDEKIEKEKEKNTLHIKSNLFFNKIYIVISKVDALTLSKDIGRNHFYHYMVNTSSSLLLEKLKNIFDEFQKGNISEELFCSYHKLHAIKIMDARNEFFRVVSKKLKEEGWDDELVQYVVQIYEQWMNNHARLLSELISSSCSPAEVIMSWWVFYYGMYMSLDEFGILLNGRIAGQIFEKLKIGKPDKGLNYGSNNKEF